MPEKESKKSLPSISSLFKESWVTFKGSVLNLFILYLISFGVFAVITIVGLLITIPLGAFSVFSAIQENTLTPAFFTSLGVMGIVILIFIIIFIIVSLALNAAMIMVVANYKSKPSSWAMFKKGFSYVLPLILASIITGFLIYGGFFLFVIPGIVFGIALSFTYYEIVLNKKPVLSAMRRSMGIVFANFWGILGRMLLFMVVVFAIVLIPQIIIGASGDEGIAAGFGFLSFIIQTLIGWYAVAYSLTLYKQAEAAAPDGKTSKLLLPTILAVVGWILGVILIGAIITAITVFLQNFNPANLPSQDQLEQLQNPAVQRALEDPTEENMRALLDLFPTDSPERAQLEAEIERQFSEEGMMQDEMMMEDYTAPSPTQN